jgi:CHASE3 domain sensor protein
MMKKLNLLLLTISLSLLIYSGITIYKYHELQNNIILMQDSHFKLFYSQIEQLNTLLRNVTNSENQSQIPNEDLQLIMKQISSIKTSYHGYIISFSDNYYEIEKNREINDLFNDLWKNIAIDYDDITISDLKKISYDVNRIMEALSSSNVIND